MSVGMSAMPEFDAFSVYVKELIEGGENDLKLEDAVARFRAYQHDLERLKEKLRPSIEQADRGEVKELDLDEFFRKFDTECEARGIPE